ncbi:hypothetical protein [Cohnella cellulosilytica]|uniref:hypothetical protein n=1 Tax=Cohnella cellulosilytica TaxID=986710 RepID=UPI0036100795
MPQTSYPFPMYSGLLEPGHYNKIGSAIWLFLWCVSATTAEKEKEGTVWGIVLGNKPIKREDLASQFGVAERTVQRWIDTLEQQGYIRITRAPYGMIFTVRKSKKFVDRLDNNVQSPPRVDKNVQSEPQEWTEMSSLSSERADKNVHSNKDIIKDLDVDAVDDRDSEFESILKAYCEIHQKLDMQVRPLDIKLMQEMIALGVPPLIIRVMQQVHQLKMARSERVSSFAFYKNAIMDAWEAERAITEGVPIPEGVPLPPVALGSPQRKTKQQRDLEELDRMQEEAMRDGNGRGHRSDEGH